MMGCAKDETPTSAIDTDSYVNSVLAKASMNIPQNVQVYITKTPEELETNSKGPSVEITSKKDYFGWGASAVTAASADKGIQTGNITNPSLTTNPETGETSIGTSKFGKSTAGSGGGTWFSMLIATIKDYAFTIGGIIILLVIGGVVLYFLVPAAQPIISTILRWIASIFPVLGATVENWVGKKKVAAANTETVAVTSTVENVVIGIQTMKDNLYEMIDNTNFAPTDKSFDKTAFKENVKKMINTTLKSEQNQSDEDLISELKRANRL
jgi:hypothetical protein